MKIYLDNNATTPLDENVKNVIVRSLDLWANPSSDNENAENCLKSINDARQHLCRMFDVDAAENIIFTSGGTEANNWIINSSINESPHSKPHIVTTNIEHPSIMEPLREKLASSQIDVTFVPVDTCTGHVNVDDVIHAINDSTCLITIMLANNETGVIQPVANIFERVRRLRTTMRRANNPIVLHSDVAQAAGKMKVSIRELNADFLTVVGHKFYGPRNGALIRASTNIGIVPMLYGGNQEFGLRSGTENTPMIAGLGEAARVFCDDSEGINKKLEEIRDHLELRLKEELGDKIRIHFSESQRLPNTTSVAFMSYESHGCELLANCRSFNASTGAACHKNECSPILKACGIDESIASKTLRLSVGRTTTRDQIDQVVAELKKLCC